MFSWKPTPLLYSAIPSAEITLPVMCIMTRGIAGSQVTLCGTCIITRGTAGSQVTLCGECIQHTLISALSLPPLSLLCLHSPLSSSSLPKSADFFDPTQPPPLITLILLPCPHSVPFLYLTQRRALIIINNNKFDFVSAQSIVPFELMFMSTII